jgi:molecular chaperone DnaJ
MVPISFTVAALGGHINVPVIGGEMKQVTIPEGTQTGRQIRLRGMGMPILRSREKGDLYVQVVVETPQKLTARQRELLRELENDSGTDNAADQAGFFEKMKSFISGNDD